MSSVKDLMSPKNTYLIEIDNLTKSFQRKKFTTSSYSTLKSLLLSALNKKKKVSDSNSEFFALKGLTLKIRAGSCVGVIGRNGSGKSTLLKLISGIYSPSCGQVSINGRVAALIELGAGFHPDFTGRENVYLAGVMNGMTKAEINEAFATIVGFAELQEVIDEPVRTYSSGMFMRLGFSLAVHCNPDILIIDEVLAVGDAGFVNKCNDKIAELRKDGKTILLVTHDAEAVLRWCDEVVWLEKGEVQERGSPRRVIDAYRQFIEKNEADSAKHDKLERFNSANNEIQQSKASRWGSKEIAVISVKVVDKFGIEREVYHFDDFFEVVINYQLNNADLINERINDLVLGIAINRSDGLNILGTNTAIEEILFNKVNNEGVCKISFDRVGLLGGVYSIDIAFHRRDGYPYDYLENSVQFSIRDHRHRLGVALPPINWSI
jgi:lipopolysaccharide transport system ATP-binding protein